MRFLAFLLLILVNGAQAMRSGVPFEEHTDADFELAISTGLWGAFRFMRAAFPYLRPPDFFRAAMTSDLPW